MYSILMKYIYIYNKVGQLRKFKQNVLFTGEHSSLKVLNYFRNFEHFLFKIRSSKLIVQANA